MNPKVVSPLVSQFSKRSFSLRATFLACVAAAAMFCARPAAGQGTIILDTNTVWLPSPGTPGVGGLSNFYFYGGDIWTNGIVASVWTNLLGIGGAFIDTN